MYKLFTTVTNKQLIHRIADNAFIPMDEANTDYQAYLAWLEDGNVPTPAEENT